MNALARDILHQEIARLRDREALLAEQVRQLNAMLAPIVIFPGAWKLTRQESLALASLYGSPSGFRSKEALHAAMSGDIELETDDKIVDVIIHKIRRKLPPSVVITTVWGEGYALEAMSRNYVAAAMGHPTDPSALADFIRESTAMSFDIVQSPIAKGSADASVLLRESKISKPALVIGMSAAFASKTGFTAKDRFQLAIGKGDKKGLLRLQRHESGGFVPKVLRAGALVFHCGWIERFGTEAQAKENVRIDVIDKDTVEIVLPKWADEIED
ncbi:winged helix-turn-helix domain-containing protein [Bradyrhizobium liaoningense]|uniref:winged helix-turn-helix domain-containing protein n=1 Tax=Bradyrhizobium liaoningense TaxID=43992 RepID=UPI001BAE1E86|nr:winged helix-turn-helix domain-containing protein [Bradyrhizobium liaoningense]MBR0855642.1 winged helix-turn-helix domain-containing protein [Bradyrhizobium liaoningense]